MAKPFSDGLVSVFLYCPTHNTVGLKEFRDRNSLYLLVGPVFPIQSIEDALEKVLTLRTAHLLVSPKEWLRPGEEGCEFLASTRVLMKKSGRTLQNWIFKANMGEKYCCHYFPAVGNDITWISRDQLKDTALIGSIWGPEPLFADDIHTIIDSIVDDRDFQQLQRVFIKKHPYPDLITAAELTSDRLHDLYEDFFIHCHPSTFMTEASFKSFLKILGWKNPSNGNDDDNFYGRLFSSFLHPDRLVKDSRFRFLTFREFVDGLLIRHPKVAHGGGIGAKRLEAILQFYDSSKTGQLNIEDLQRMKNDIEIATGKKSTIEPSTLTYPMNLKSLKEAVNEKKIQGTSVLLRLGFKPFSSRVYTPSFANSKCPRHSAQSYVIAPLIRTIRGLQVVDIKHL